MISAHSSGPVSIATAQRAFSTMKLVKTRLRTKMGMTFFAIAR